MEECAYITEYFALVSERWHQISGYFIFVRETSRDVLLSIPFSWYVNWMTLNPRSKLRNVRVELKSAVKVTMHFSSSFLPLVYFDIRTPCCFFWGVCVCVCVCVCVFCLYSTFWYWTACWERNSKCWLTQRIRAFLPRQRPNLVPRVFSFSNISVANGKTLRGYLYASAYVRTWKKCSIHGTENPNQNIWIKPRDKNSMRDSRKTKQLPM